MKKKLASFVADGNGGFGALALELWAWQIAHNAQYAAFCDGRKPRHWREIPAVPVTLFRDLAWTCFPEETAKVVFETSGTTGRPGRHSLQDTDLYDLGAVRHAEAVLGPLPGDGVFLVRPGSGSSLAHMCERFCPDGLHAWSPEHGLDARSVWASLRGRERPVFLAMTGLAAAELIAPCPASCLLPGGSVVMLTGGFKGAHVDVDASSLWIQLADVFPGARLVGEYGMTELSSQLWAPSPAAAFQPPAWLRALTVDPWTGDPLEDGKVGLLCFVDLLNHQTVLAVETQDLGRVGADGSVTLEGRLPQAEPRGCSLPMEGKR